MHRLAAILLVLLFAALGSGTLGRLHDLTHQHEDAEGQSESNSHHDGTNCVLHALLRSPLMNSAHVPLLVSLGLLVAFLTMLAPRLLPQRVPVRIACRGPPGF